MQTHYIHIYQTVLAGQEFTPPPFCFRSSRKGEGKSKTEEGHTVREGGEVPYISSVAVPHQTREQHVRTRLRHARWLAAKIGSRLPSLRASQHTHTHCQWEWVCSRNLLHPLTPLLSTVSGVSQAAAGVFRRPRHRQRIPRRSIWRKFGVWFMHTPLFLPLWETRITPISRARAFASAGSLHIFTTVKTRQH